MASGEDVVRAVWEARRLLEGGWSLPLPLRPSEIEGEWTVCNWDHPMAERFPIEEAVLRGAGGVLEVALEVFGILDQLVAPQVLLFAFPGEKLGEGWGGHLLSEWETREGRTQADVLALLDKAKRKVRGMWQA